MRLLIIDVPILEFLTLKIKATITVIKLSSSIKNKSVGLYHIYGLYMVCTDTGVSFQKSMLSMISYKVRNIGNCL